jgi:predicted nucleic acid-binding protein
MTEKLAVIYWDSSGLMSYLFKDSQSEEVIAKARQKGAHLLTSLAVAEVYAVINLIRSEQVLSEMIIENLFALLESGPWSRLNIVPDSAFLKELSIKWQLKGSALWHLATAKTLQREFPELMILTFDRELAEASKGEGLKVCVTRKQ